MNFFKSSIVILLWIAMVQCKPTENSSDVAYIIGNNDIHQLDATNQKDLSEKVKKAAVLIAVTYKVGNESKVKFGSGTLIEGNRILTNHHVFAKVTEKGETTADVIDGCLLYTSPSPRDKRQSRMPSSA